MCPVENLRVGAGEIFWYIDEHREQFKIAKFCPEHFVTLI
jgi:hypothetical protein